MRWLAIAGLLCVPVVLIAADKPKEKPLTPAQLKAVSKYDHLPDEWKEKAIEAWKASFRFPENRARLLKNNPPYYPGIVSSDVNGHARLLPDSWGVIGFRTSETEPTSVRVAQVISPSRALVHFGRDSLYFVDGIDTSSLTDDTVAHIQGIFFIDGTESYKTASGAQKTVFIAKPIPTKDEGVKPTKKPK